MCEVVAPAVSMYEATMHIVSSFTAAVRGYDLPDIQLERLWFCAKAFFCLGVVSHAAAIPHYRFHHAWFADIPNVPASRNNNCAHH